MVASSSEAGASPSNHAHAFDTKSEETEGDFDTGEIQSLNSSEGRQESRLSCLGRGMSSGSFGMVHTMGNFSEWMRIISQIQTPPDIGGDE